MTYLISVFSVYTKLETLSISPVFVLLQSLQEDIVYGLLFCTCFSQAYLASTQSVTQKHWRLATRLTGDYLDQTFTGKLITACRTHDFHLRERAHSAQTKRAPQGVHIKKIGKVKLFTFPIFILRGQKKPANPVPKWHPKRHLI